jgi:hypothetical protein
MTGTTAPGSYADIPNTSEFDVLVVADDSFVEIEMQGSFYLSGTVGGADAYFAVSIDSGAETEVFRLGATNGAYGNHMPYARSILVGPLGSGTHHFQPRWKAVGSSSISVDTKDQLTVRVREIH